MAAGKGSRLVGGAGGSKPMFPIHGRPMIAQVIDRIYNAGIENLVVTVRPGDVELLAFLGEERRFGALSVIQKDTRAALDSFLAIEEALAGNPRMICTCDVRFSERDLRDFLKFCSSALARADMVALVSRFVHDARPIWVEADRHGRILKYGKSIPETGLVYGNIRALNADFRLGAIPSTIGHLTDLMTHLIARGDFSALAHECGAVVDVDSMDDLKFLNDE